MRREGPYREAPPPPEPAERGPYTQLTAFARSRQIPYEGALSLRVEDHGRWLRLSYSLNSGTVTGYDVEVPIAHTPYIVLRVETDTDRKGKGRGINREVQTGDTAFDLGVYIETDEGDRGVLRVLVPEVRAAMLELFGAGVTSVQLAGGIASFNVAETKTSFSAESVENVVCATRGLAKIRHTRARENPEAGRGAGPMIGTILLTLAAVPCAIAAQIQWNTEGVGLQLTAAAVGVVSWWSSRSWLARATGGSSQSYRRYLTSVSFAFVGMPLASIALATMMNGALSGRTVDVRFGVVDRVREPDEGRTYVDVAWKGGGSTETWWYTCDRAPRKGDVAEGHFRRGFLFAAWRDRPLMVGAPR